MRFIFGTAVLGLSALAFACTATSTTIPIDDSPDGGKTTSSSPTDPKPGSSSGTSSSGGTLCDQVCAKAASANCSGQSTCVKDCEAQSAQVPASCKTQMDDALKCAATKATSFKCSSSGKATAVGCDTEGNALVQCMMNGGSSSGGSSSGGSSSGGGGNCGSISTGNATCDSCVDASCCSQAAACGSECVAILQCFQNCNDNTCYTTCENQHPTGKSQEQALLSCVSSSCNAQCQ